MKVSPTGTSVTPSGPNAASVPRAMRAAPVRSGWSAGSLWLVPSGKRAMAPPAASSSWQRAKLSSFFAMSPAASCRR